MNIGKAKEYLEAVAQDYQSLEEHDRIYHKGGYKEGDRCQVREKLKKSDDPDEATAKAGRMAARTSIREKAKPVLEELLEGHVRFTGDDSEGPVHSMYWKGKDALAVEFEVEKGRENHFGDAGTRNMERALAESGYKAWIHEGPHRWDKPGTSYSGRIRPFTPDEMLDRVTKQRPEWNRDGYWVVDGEEYGDMDEATAAWKAAMAKYGKAAKGK